MEKKFSDLVGSGTRDLPAYITVPQQNRIQFVPECRACREQEAIPCIIASEFNLPYVVRYST
jgi:hypothetical protein